MDTSLVNPTPIVCHLEEKELIFDLTVPKKIPKTQKSVKNLSVTILNPYNYSLEVI
jgi:hypothetical protein